MFRCPTCVAVLTDPAARRCTMCGQGLRRRRPRLLGQEHRPGSRLLPIDRAMAARIDGNRRGRRRSKHATLGWMEQYRSSVAAAAARTRDDHERRDDGTGRAATDGEPPFPEAELRGALTGAASPPVPEKLDVGAYLAAFDPPARAAASPPVIAPEPLTIATVPAAVVTPADAGRVEPILPETGPLDPEVQALVDDLSRRARAEIAGAVSAPRGVEEADGFATVDAAPGAGPPLAPADPDAHADLPRRRGWVPAVLAERRRQEGPGARRPNGNGWKRLDLS